MKYVAAYALLALNKKKDIAAKDLTAFLKNCGVEVDEAGAENVCNALKGKELHEVISEGLGKVATLSFGGAGAAAPAGGAPAGGNAPAAKKEEEPAEEENVSMGGLFD